MRSFKKIAAMIMAVAMLCSFTALGAEVYVDYIELDGNVATIYYIAEEVDEVTALVYTGDLNSSDANIVYIDQFDSAVYADDGLSVVLEEEGDHTVLLGGTGVAISDVCEDYFTYEAGEQTYTISLAPVTNNGGYIRPNKSLSETFESGAEIELTFAPYIGYALDSLTIGGNVISGLEPVNGVYTYKHTVTANAEIVVRYEAIETSAEGDVHTSGGIYNIAAGAERASKIAFGKAVVGTSGKNIVSRGMEVFHKVDGEYVPFQNPSEQGTEGLFAAEDGKWTNDGAYGIRFFGFADGDYRIRAYVQYEGDAEPVYGDPVFFTVG